MSKVVIVTGASRGIGADIAETLARKGYTVIANYNNSTECANDLKERLWKDNIYIDIFKADVSKRDEAKQLVNFVIEKYHKIDVLINNAGIDQIKLFTEITDDDWESIIRNNLNSVFYMSQEVVKYMIHKKRGNIINMSSVWGVKGASCECSYSVSKAGVDAITKSLAKELGPSNIKVNSIAPGIIETEMNKFLSDKEKNDIKDEIPLQKIGNVKDVTRCVEWLIEDEYVTGQIILIDGGWSI